MVRGLQNTSQQIRPLDGAEEVRTFSMTKNQVGLYLQHMMDPKMQISTVIGVADVDVKHVIDFSLLDASFQAAFRDHVTLHGVYNYNDVGEGFWVSVRKPEFAPINHVFLHRRGSFAEDQMLSIAAQDLSVNTNIGIQLHVFEHTHKTVLVFATFQFILDGFSVTMFINDVIRRYSTGESVFPVSYLEKNMEIAAALAAVQAEKFSARHAQLKNYWLDHLKISEGKPLPTLSISAPPPTSLSQVPQSPEVRFTITQAQFARVQQLSKQLGARTSSIFLAVWTLLLGRYAQQSAVLISMVFSGRSESQTHTMGSFACQLPLRVDFTDLTAPFASFIQNLSFTLSGHIQHQDYAPIQLMQDIREAAPQYKHLSTLGEADFNYFNIPKPEAPMVRWQVANGIQQGTMPLSLWMFSEGSHGNQEVTGWLKYNPKLFDQKFVEQMTAHYTHILGQALDQPLTPIRDLQLSQQRQQSSLTTTIPFLPVHKLVEIAAFASPLKPAVIFEDETLTYLELIQKSTRVALHLQQVGVKPGTIIGLMHRRSANMVVAMLGAMLAGAAYTPLDPSLPSTRLQQMLEECSCNVVLTHDDMLSSPLLANVRPFAVEAFLSEQPYLTTLQSSSNMLDLAYTVFTSGSTGAPKGIAVHHTPLVHLIQWAVNHFDLRNPRTVFLTPLQISFDPHVFDIFTTLCAGATVVITKEGGLRDPNYLIGLMKSHNVTHFACVPSLLNMMLTTLDATVVTKTGKPKLPSLTHLLVGGEGLPWNLARTATVKLPHVNVWNMYGPAEATIVTTCYSVNKNMHEFQKGGVVPIGSPIPGVATLVLGANESNATDTKHHQVAPQGTVGELCVFGRNLSRGYVRRGSTDFVDHPYLENVKMYKTGDLVRERPSDGVIEYVGRKDTQVKLRGHRIELIEITSALTRNETVGKMIEFSVCKMLTHVTTKKPFLALYIELKKDLPSVPDRETFGKVLSDSLPSYMVPEYIVLLSSVILNHNGKVDVKALPHPAESDKWIKTIEYVAPISELEEIICEAFSQVLGCAEVGSTHNFFNNGGNSMLAINCITIIKQKSGKALSVPQFYANPTPRQLVDALSDEKPTRKFVQLMYSPKNASRKLKQKLFLVPGAIRTSLVFNQLVESLPENFPFEMYSFTDPDGLLDGNSSEPQTMAEIVEPFIKEMLEIQPRNANAVYYIMGYSVGGLIAMDIANRLKESGSNVQLIMADTRNPIKMLNMDLPAIHAMIADEFGLRYNYVSKLTAMELKQHSSEGQLKMLVSEIVEHRILDLAAAEKLVTKSSNYFKTATSMLGSYHVPNLSLPVTLLSAAQNRFHVLESIAPSEQPPLRQLVLQAHQQLQEPVQPTQPTQNDLGWGSSILAKWLNIVKVPGDHFTMLLKPHVSEFARVLLQELSKPVGKAKL